MRSTMMLSARANVAEARMDVLVGTSGYAYKEWKGSFYPEDLPNDEMLRFYGRAFRTVEINNTFYRMPTEKVLRDWAEQVPEGFSFVLKASRRITHFARLKNVDEPLSFILQNASLLGPKLGPLLFQLPPNMKKDLPRLREFLTLIPKQWRAAFEFRHATWFDEEIYDALRERNVALCIADTDDSETDVVPTADFGYARLRREQYADTDLAEWARRLTDQPWKNAFVFFKHEDAGAGPKLAKQFIELVPAEQT